MGRILRAGVLGPGLIAASLVWLGACYAWREMQIWVPLHNAPIPLKQGQVQSPEFEINLESFYGIGISPWEPWQHSEYANEPSREWRWSVLNGGQTVAQGSRVPVGGYLGTFRARKGLYVLRVTPGESPAVPTSVSISECGARWNEADQRIANAFRLFVAILLANLFGAIFVAITRKIERREVQARAYSLTQPGSQGPAPRVDSMIRHPWVSRPSLKPDFAKPSWVGLVFWLTWGVALMGFWMVHLAIDVSFKGLPVRLLRPGVQGQRMPNLDPLVVRVSCAEDCALPYPPYDWLHPDMRNRRIAVWQKRVAPVVYFNSQRISWEQLGPLLDRELPRRPPDWPVYVQGDVNLEWKSVVRAIDIVRGKGAQVVLLTDRGPSR
jgi:hypothetical protein